MGRLYVTALNVSEYYRWLFVDFGSDVQRVSTKSHHCYQGFITWHDFARTGATSTATMTRAKAGRASYLSADKLAGFNDPGAEGVARLFEHLAGH